MNSGNIKLSVCITAYNVGKYISYTLESVLKQRTNFEFEILIGEDGSKDDTKDIIEKYREGHPDKITIFYNEKNLGVNATLLNLVEKAQGEYIAQIDGDDIVLTENRLQIMADFLDGHAEYSVCFNNYQTIDETGNVLAKDAYGSEYKHIERDTFLYRAALGGMAMWRKSALPKPIPKWLYKVGGKIDYAIMMLVSANHLVGYLPEVLMSYRLHNASVTRSRKKEEMLEKDIFMCQRFREYYTPIDKKYDSIFKSGASYYGYILSYLMLSKGKIHLFLYYFIRAFINWPVWSIKKHKDYLFMASPELFDKMKSILGMGK